MQQKRRGGSNWVGWVIFILVVFGSRLLPPMANWLSQITGLPIDVPVLVIALIVLSVIVSVINSVIRGVGQIGSGNDTRLPTGPSASPGPPVARPVPPPRNISPTSQSPGFPPTSQSPGFPPTSQPPRLPPASAQLPTPNLPSGEQRLPGAPRFEPIVDPRILVIGIAGLLLIGGVFFIVLLSVGALP